MKKLTNNRMGEEVFNQFKNKLASNGEWFDVSTVERVGSRLVIESPFVSKSFEDAGFKVREQAFGMTVFRPNIRMEDFAVVSGEISTITLATTEARARVTTERILRYPTVRQQMRDVGVSEEGLYRCVLDAAIRELMQVSYVGDLGLSVKAKEAAAFAVIKRATLKNGNLRGTIEAAGVDWRTDVKAVAQFSGEIDFEGFVQDLYEKEPYFNRRADIIDCARFETTAGKIDMGELGDITLVDKLLAHLVGKSKRVDPWLRKAMTRSLAN